jgi:hypothetical protein
MIKRLFLLVFLLLLFGGIAAYFLVPWNNILEQRIIAFLNEKGLQNISFDIDNVGIHQATFSNIKIGKENPLLLQSVTVQYNPKELAEGNLRGLTLTGLDIEITQTKDGWAIAGLDDLRSKTGREKSAITFSDIVDILPFSFIDIKDSHLRITGKSIQTALPFNMRLAKSPETSLEMTINATNLTSAKSDISLGLITVKAKPDDKRDWKGTWTLESLDAGKSLPIPVMTAAGELAYAGGIITVEGDLNSADKTYTASFSMLIDTKATEKNTLTITSVAFPFKEGTVYSKNVIIPFNRAKNITVNLDIRKVSLDALMQTLTGQRVTATGTVSGRVPIIVKPDGSYTLGKGTLKADSEGLIQMPGDVIPGDNEQVQLVRQILENLHYSVFSAAIETGGDKGMVVKLSLEGSNPDVYNGRVIKLNVNLTGDVLDFIQQNAMLITNPEQLLKQGTQ